MPDETPKDVYRIRSSEISLFQRCQRSWMLSYHRQLEPAWGLRLQPRPFDVGNAVHAGLEKFYPDHDLESAIQALHAHEKEMFNKLSPEAETKDWAKVYAKAHAMLEHYPAWLDEEGLDIGEESHAIEERLEMPLCPGYVLTGQPDHIKTCEFGYILEDWKTGDIKRPFMMESDWQLLNYALLMRHNYGEIPFEIRHRRLNPSLHTTRVKNPQYAEHAVSFTERRVNHHEKLLHNAVKELVAMRDRLLNGGDPVFTAVPHRDALKCSWDCSFTEVCSAMDDDGDWEYLLEVNYRPRERA